MQISSLVDIVRGNLLNSPSISFITQIHTVASKINEGDLFISNSLEDIKYAISKGAFAVITDFKLDFYLIDNEIAWIKVDNISKSLVKLTRFILSNTNNKSFYCDDISFELLSLFSPANKNTIFLTNDIKKDFEIIKKYDNKTIFSTDSKYIKDILPLTINFMVKEFSIQNLTIHSLFNTTFSYNGHLFYKLKLPRIYVNSFLASLEFLSILITDEISQINFDANKLKYIKYFAPIFINKNFEVVDFGKSNKFILANKNINLINDEIKFLKANYGYAKVYIIENFKDNNDLLNQIEQLDFNALYVVGKSSEEIKTLLESFKKDLKTLI